MITRGPSRPVNPRETGLRVRRAEDISVETVIERGRFARLTCVSRVPEPVLHTAAGQRHMGAVSRGRTSAPNRLPHPLELAAVAPGVDGGESDPLSTVEEPEGGVHEPMAAEVERRLACPIHESVG